MDPQTLTQPNPAAALAQPAAAAPAATAAPPAGVHTSRSADCPWLRAPPVWRGLPSAPRDPVCLPRSRSAAGGGERGDAGSRTPGAGLRCASPPARSRSLSALVPPDHASGHRATAECARGRGVAQTRTCLVYPCRASCSINRIRCPARQYPRPHSRRTFASAACAHGLLRLRFSGGSADRGARKPVRLQNPRLPFPRRPSKGCASAPPVLPRPAPGRTLDRGSCGSRSLTH